MHKCTISPEATTCHHLTRIYQFSAAPAPALFHHFYSVNKDIKVLTMITTSSNPVRCPPPLASRVRARRSATEGWMHRGKPRTRRYQRAVTLEKNKPITAFLLYLLTINVALGPRSLRGSGGVVHFPDHILSFRPRPQP